MMRPQIFWLMIYAGWGGGGKLKKVHLSQFEVGAGTELGNIEFDFKLLQAKALRYVLNADYDIDLNFSKMKNLFWMLHNPGQKLLMGCHNFCGKQMVGDSPS